LLDLLEDRLVDYKAAVHRTTAAGLPATLAEVVAATLPPGGRLVVPPGLPPAWGPAADDVTIDHNGLSAVDLDALDGVLTACAAAAAETGTIVLDGSPDQGRRAITLVPDRHICVVHAHQVVQTVPELIARLDPTRPLTFISGPSATSDIELQRVEGVHGPRTLVVVLVDRSAPDTTHRPST
jgi:L-lactate dehydrogenase complex protein LldG